MNPTTEPTGASSDSANPTPELETSAIGSFPPDPWPLTGQPNGVPGARTVAPDAAAVGSRREGDKNATGNGGKFVAWSGFIFGTVLSVAMNWLHTWLPADTKPDGWTPGVAPQIMSAVWPLCLLLAVEVLSRVRWPKGLAWRLARYGGVGTVAAGSAVISYGHVYEVLHTWGYGTLGAAVGPLVMDGLMVACGFAMLTETTTAPTPGDTVSAGRPAPGAPATEEPSILARDTAATAPASGATTGNGSATEATAPTTDSDTGNDGDRDVRIRQMHREGASTRQIGRAVGLHHSTVARILAEPDTRDSGDTDRDTSGGLALAATTANGKESH